MIQRFVLCVLGLSTLAAHAGWQRLELNAKRDNLVAVKTQLTCQAEKSVADIAQCIATKVFPEEQQKLDLQRYQEAIAQGARSDFKLLKEPAYALFHQYWAGSKRALETFSKRSSHRCTNPKMDECQKLEHEAKTALAFKALLIPAKGRTWSEHATVVIRGLKEESPKKTKKN